MAQCPKCGTLVVDPLKTWSLVSKPSRKGEGFKLTIGLYECSACRRKFRVVLGKERVTIKGLVTEIKGIEEGLTQTLGNLREKIEKLENEKVDLLTEIEELRKVGEAKANTLKEEITSLRDELKSLRELLGNLK